MAPRKARRQRTPRRELRSVELERDVPANPDAIERALEDIVTSLRQSRCACGDLDEVRLALREALNNAVRHGSRLNPRKRIHVTCRCNPQDGLWVRVRDEGGGFNPAQVPDPTAPENLERFSGRGLYMIRKLMDEVQFRDRGREIHMRRRPRS